MLFFHKYIVRIFLALVFLFYLPMYVIIYLWRFGQLVVRYIWIQKIKKQIFYVSYTYHLPETGKWYDLVLYFLIYTPIYYANKIFILWWQGKVQWVTFFKLKNILLISLSWFIGIPLITRSIVKYWHIMIIIYNDNPDEFLDNYFTIHSKIFFNE